MKFTTLIPTHYNDGTPVSATRMRAILRRLAHRFGGCSDEGLTKGQWIDPTDSMHFHDEGIRVTVVCDRTLLDVARKAVIRIGVALEQRAMYFEVRDYDGVQFLEIPFKK